MNIALDSVHPVTLAVGKIMKRFFIVVSSVLMFHNLVTIQVAIGSAVGIAGVLQYSLIKQFYEELERKEAEEAASIANTVGRRQC